MIAIDLGSNTIRAIEIDCKDKKFGQSYDVMVKTADGLIHTQNISDGAVERIIAALLEMQKIWDFNAHRVKATTTAAMRMARNQTEVIEKIFQACGVRFEVIDADKEAYYTNLAVVERMKALGYRDEPFLLLDVGGGSTEVIYSDAHQQISKSLDVGIVTMSQEFSSREALRDAMYERFDTLKKFCQNLPQNPIHLVATAGTPTTMAALKQGMNVKSYDPQKINGTRLSLDDLEQGLNRLLAMDEATREEYVGVGRDSLIVAGVEILKVLYDLLGFDSSIVVDDGLREGLALDICKQKS